MSLLPSSVFWIPKNLPPTHKVFPCMGERSDKPVMIFTFRLLIIRSSAGESGKKKKAAPLSFSPQHNTHTRLAQLPSPSASTTGQLTGKSKG